MVYGIPRWIKLQLWHYVNYTSLCMKFLKIVIVQQFCVGDCHRKCLEHYAKYVSLLINVAENWIIQQRLARDSDIKL